jgi:uncharacterized damage-inducible protein DinB
MQLSDHVALMAEYNAWMNTRLYETCTNLSASELAQNRNAYFGSIIGTLNHLVVADIIWLKRIASSLQLSAELDAVARLPMPASLDEVLHSDLGELTTQRLVLDDAFLTLSQSLSDATLKQTITFRNMKGVEHNEVLFSLLMHVFNHQTHHRGQATTLLSQAGLDVGVTDLVAFMRMR